MEKKKEKEKEKEELNWRTPYSHIASDKLFVYHIHVNVSMRNDE